MRSIRFEQVVKQYPGNPRPSVDHCDFVVEAGEFVVLLGPSGCGKTTLLKMVNRIYEPTGGRILIGDSDVRQLDVNALRRQIGYVIQQVGLFPHMTVAQNIAVVPSLLHWDKNKTSQRTDELLALVGLPPQEYGRRYPAQLSGGQQQRVGLARALAADPEVMLMDEPFGAIDAITRGTLQTEMLRLRNMLGKTILFVTHDVEEALRLANRIVVMRDGKVVQYDTPINILNHPADEFVYNLVGADDITRHLGLLPVSSAMTTTPPGSLNLNGAPQVTAQDDLRHALSILLNSDANELVVTDNGAPVGKLSLENIRGSAHIEKSLSYILANPGIVWDLTLRHIQLVGLALLVALIVALPVGTLISRVRWLATPIMGVLGILYTIPSLALIILLLPIFGLNGTSVVIALIIYAQVILVRNVVAGFTAISPAITEAAKGMGMNGWQRWYRVEFPLALPIILAGLRIAAIVCIGIATIGAKFAAGGLGDLLFQGISQYRYDKIWAGTIAVAVLALAANGILLLAERAFDPVVRSKRAERRVTDNRRIFESEQPTQI